MAPLSSTLAWKIPWTEEPGGLHALSSVSNGALPAGSSSQAPRFVSG